MFVHVSPELSALGETISTLKFSERVSTVELGAAKANKESADVKELKEQVLHAPFVFLICNKVCAIFFTSNNITNDKFTSFFM